jgi:hypothetical protein
VPFHDTQKSTTISLAKFAATLVFLSQHGSNFAFERMHVPCAALLLSHPGRFGSVFSRLPLVKRQGGSVPEALSGSGQVPISTLRMTGLCPRERKRSRAFHAPFRSS